MAINIQNLIKDITIKETQQTPTRINAKRSRLSHISTKLLKPKDKG